MKQILSIATLFFATNTALADMPEIVFEDKCEITPQIWQLTTPPESTFSNNLRRKTGSSEFAQGDMILVEGKVVDSACAPVGEAVVEIWQGDAYGEYDQRKMDENFLGSGTSITDNLGNYKFLTVFPGTKGNKEAPHIHFRIKHKDFRAFETIMFFENQLNNDVDRNLNKEVKQSQKHLLLAKAKKLNKNDDRSSIKYVFDITLEGKNKYLSY